MPLPTTFAGDASRAEGQFTKISSGPAPIGGPYFANAYHDNYAYGGSSSYAGIGSADYITGVKVDTSGNIYYTGFCQSNSGNSTILVTKLNSSGVVQWCIYLTNGTAPVSVSINSRIELDSSGVPYVCFDSYVYKLDASTGSVLWRFGVPQPPNGSYARGACYIKSTTTDSSGNLYALYTYNAGSLKGGAVYKFSSSGTVLNTVNIESSTTGIYTGGFGCTDVKIDNNGYMYVAHLSNGSSPATSFNSGFTTFDSSFNVITSYGALGNNASGPQGATGWANPKIGFDSSNNLFMSANQFNTTGGAGQWTGVTTAKFTIPSYSGSGWSPNVIWAYTLSAYSPTVTYGPPTELKVDSNGNCFTAYPQGTSATAPGYATKYNASGSSVSFADMQGTSYKSGNFFCLDIDRSGNVYLGGASSNNSANTGSKVSYYDTSAILFKDINSFQTTYAHSALTIPAIFTSPSYTVNYSSTANSDGSVVWVPATSTNITSGWFNIGTIAAGNILINNYTSSTTSVSSSYTSANALVNTSTAFPYIGTATVTL